MIFDFDDAIWLPTVSSGNRTLAWLKNPAKTDELLRMADMVFAGNRYLADYASQFSDCVRIVPTTVDTDVFRPEARIPRRDGVVEIGWTGSRTTIDHFVYLVPTLVRIREKYGDRVRFKVIGDEVFRDDRLGLRGIPWRRETELDDLSTMDIGIMPLPDSPWTRGKCGFKGLTYMSLGIPAVLSPVGVNTEIVDDGINGFLADSEDQWVDRLSRLIEQPELRTAVGTRGRATVVARYSVASQKDRYVQYFREVLEGHARSTS
jgi:glycosyltransferase involved in cell wall biosynthesis